MSRELYGVVVSEKEEESECRIDNHDLAFLMYETLQQISQITEKHEVKIRVNLANWYLREIVGDVEFNTIKERYKDISEMYKISI